MLSADDAWTGRLHAMSTCSGTAAAIPQLEQQEHVEHHTRDGESKTRHADLLGNSADAHTKMMPAGEQCRRRQRGLTGKRQKGAQVGASRPRQFHGSRVHDFFAAQLDLIQRPAHRRMEPEQRSHELFAEHPDPVSSLDMQQFMAGDRALRLEGQRLERVRQQDGSLEAERDRLPHGGMRPDHGTEGESST